MQLQKRNRKYSPQNGRGIGQIVYIHPEESGNDFAQEDLYVLMPEGCGNEFEEDLYALNEMPDVMDEDRRRSFRTITYVEAAYIYLRLSFGP